MGEKTGVKFDAEPLEPVLGVQFVVYGGGKSGTGTIAVTNIRIE